MKGGTDDFDENVVAIASGYFIGISVNVYKGRITAGTIDFYCAISGAGIGDPARLLPDQYTGYRRLPANTYAFAAGDWLGAIYSSSPDFAAETGTAVTGAVWVAYDY